MSHQFHVGQKVVCIRKGPWPSPRECDGDPMPEFNHIYTVTEMEWRQGRCGLILAELHPDDCHWSKYFQPVQTRKTDISIFKALLVPTKSKQSEFS